MKKLLTSIAVATGLAVGGVLAATPASAAIIETYTNKGVYSGTSNAGTAAKNFCYDKGGSLHSYSLKESKKVKPQPHSNYHSYYSISCRF